MPFPGPPRTEGPRPAAAIAFVRDTSHGIEIYLSRRPMHFRYFPGAFVFPGGRVEAGDADIRATACREVKEEIGVEVLPDDLVLLRETHTAAHAGPVYHLFICACLVESEMPTELNPDEVDEEIWISPAKALKQFDLPYQIMAAVQTISAFATGPDLMRRLSSGSVNEDYLY
ncbi:MAG TPA: NUDIX domain-containing protein [Blastocatellia bacterium]|nr:NUDIX domain-containing protein [Blastocatellia bacterium]